MAPDGAVDTHCHILASPSEHPLSACRFEDPADGLVFADFIARLEAQMATLGITRAVLVQSAFYATDNAVMLRAVEALGRAQTRAVALVADDVTDEALDALVEGGVVGVRLNLLRGGPLSRKGAARLVPRLAARGLHLQLLATADASVEAATEAGVPQVLDHLGWPDLTAGPDAPAFRALCAALAAGTHHVKLSGLYRLCPPPFTAADPFVAALVAANPSRCLWGSDFPFVMLRGAAPPDAGQLLDALHRVVTDEATRQRILVENPARLYGFSA